MATSINRYVRRRAALVAKLGGCCSVCGSADRMEFHHADPRDYGHSHNLGGWQQLIRLEREVAEGHDIRLLCPACHCEAHKEMGL